MISSASSLHPPVNVDFYVVKDKILRREYRADANDQPQSLHTTEAICSQILEVWPEPPLHDHLHVFVTLPDEDDSEWFFSPSTWPI